jgi:hypothetical protein
LRCLLAAAVSIAFLATRALGLLAGIVEDAGDRNGATVRIDCDGAAAIVERVLGVRGAAHQQEHGDTETLLHCDLLSGIPKPRNYAGAASPNVIQITFKL